MFTAGLRRVQPLAQHPCLGRRAAVEWQRTRWLTQRLGGRSSFSPCRTLLRGCCGLHGSAVSPAKPGNSRENSGPAWVPRREASQLRSWVPPAAWPYVELMRLDKPIGSWLLYAPCTWSIAMATPMGGALDLKLMTLFGVGAVVMRGAGCTINDMWDADLDKHVRRTAGRPLASGRVTHSQALAFLAAQLSVGLAVLLQLNMYSVVLGASSLALVVTYPLMKRVTAWPQAFLGLVFNWGALLGWAAVQGQCDWSVVLPLYAAGWGWTMVYDTVYAHQDRADDIVVGIKSTAVRFGGKTKAWVAAFGALSTAGLLLAGVNAEQGLPYFLGVGGAVAHGARCVYLTRLGVAEDCWRCFNQMKWGGAVVFGGAWASTLLP
eukprot:m.114591 g.114591  ORF g.114591 m.114591 type:complete len:377 (+) comp13058_c0_seq2:132-1262(+)